MSYNFLDCDINSTSFGRLDAPDAVASTATARIWATKEDFAMFAATMSPIAVRLVCGKVNLAVAEVRIKFVLLINWDCLIVERFCELASNDQSQV